MHNKKAHPGDICSKERGSCSTQSIPLVRALSFLSLSIWLVSSAKLGTSNRQLLPKAVKQSNQVFLLAY
eukprot:scaffold6417_cov87-Cyclotella_meneghiniana.AAC.16